VSQDLDHMAAQSDGSGVAADLVRQVSQRTRSLGEHLDGREPTEILDDVRQFARRRPGTFLLGALAAGVVAGRLARGAKAAKDGSTATTTFPPVQPAGGFAPPVVEVEPAAVPPVSPVPPPVSHPVPGSESPTYSAPGVATPDQEPVVGTWPDTDPLAGGRDLR
jgi:hypothetical protein